MIKKAVILFVLMLVFSVNVSAEDSVEEFYREQYDNAGVENIKDGLPDTAREFLEQNGITPNSNDFSSHLEPKNVFNHILSFLKSGAKSPFLAGGGILALTLISAALGAIDLKGASATAVGYGVALTAAGAVTVPIYSVINAGIAVLKGCATFMTGFIPIFGAIAVAGGRAASSTAMSGLVIGACQGVNLIADFWVMPLMGGYLALSIASSVSPIVQSSGIAEGIKKLCYFVMSLVTTVFLGVLSVQTALSASADSLSMKTAKFIVGSAIPVAGPVLSEALTTVTASLGMLRTTVGIYGVLACAVIFLPLLAELVIWRLVFNLTVIISDLLGVPKISVLLKSADTVIAVLTGLLMLTAAMFIISLGVILK